MLLAVFPRGAALERTVFPPFALPAMILVAVGANLSGANGKTPYQSCTDAVEALRCLPGLAVITVSRWYRSAPVPRSSQPDYVNGMVRLHPGPGCGQPDPAWLLSALHEVEAAQGRVRSVADAPRTLDLDLVAMGEGGRMLRSAPDPVLPHPRAHARAFVLLPLRDVAPDWVHPRIGQGLRAMIASLPEAELSPDAISPLP